MPDTARVFSFKDYQGFLLRFHPIIKQASLLSEEARSRVQQAWGYFDPTLKINWDKKEFGNTPYYNYWQSELKVPLWLAGADFKMGYDRVTGSYINPDKRTAPEGLSIVGISIPLGQGLLIDARRNTLRQARLMTSYAAAEQVKQINEIWLAAANSYWNWYNAHAQFEQLQEGVLLAERRYKAISAQVLLGDKAPIDSVEAAITMLDRKVQLEKLRADLQNARLLLSNHLWSEEGQPLELPEGARPQSGDQFIGSVSGRKLDSLVQGADSRHPELIKLRTKAGELMLERSYRRELLKPKLNVSGYLLSNKNPFNADVPKYYDFRGDNYKLGLDFTLPLLLRTERGKLREVTIKQRQVNFDLQQTSREIRNDILAAYTLLKGYETQLLIQVQSIANQQQLLRGEQQKFELGESTLFLINSRETKLIDMQLKQAELITQYLKKLAELYYKAGMQQIADSR